MDDDFDFGSYAPSIPVNSRSGSMKKLARKTDKSPQPLDTKPKNNDFDELDQLLNGDVKSKKKDNSLTKNQPTSQPKKVNDTFDSFFDEPSTNLNITSKISDKKEKPTNNLDMARTSINFKPQKSDKNSDFDIIDEEHLLPNFSRGTNERTRSPPTNQIKLPDESSFGLDLHTSMRNMRPPLKRKESQTGLGNQLSNGGLSLGLSLGDDKKEPTMKHTNTFQLSLSEETELKPTRSVNVGRKGSMDNKSEKKLEGNLTLFGEEPARKEMNTKNFSMQERTEPFTARVDSLQTKQKSDMSEMKIGESIMINEKHSQFYNPQSITISKPQNLKSSQTLIERKESIYGNQKPTNRLAEPPRLTAVVQQQQRNFYDYQKQTEHIKQAYQKQLTYLQESLDKQITISHETRERLMREANSMIEEERKRMTRMHDEEVRRLKEMSDWEKRKMEDSFKFQIQNLKSAITQYQSSVFKDRVQNGTNYEQVGSNKYRREIQQLSEQLQLQKKVLLDRENHLAKRQFQLQQRFQQLNNKKLRQQEYFRDQQKTLLEKENKLRNTILNQKKQFMDEKQKLALEAANMELDVIRRKEKLDLLVKEQQMERLSIQNQQHQVRTLNQQMMNRYKEKMNQLTIDKERVASLEADLIRKLRIIELKAKESNVPLIQTQHVSAKQNNWVRDRPQSTAAGRQQKMNQTAQRYNKVEKLANQKSSISSKMNMTSTQQVGQTFKLQDYLTSMNKNKARNNNFM